MPALTDLLEMIATRGEAAGADVVLARARAQGDAVPLAATVPEPPRCRRPHRAVALVVVAVAAVIAIAVPVAVIASRSSSPARPSARVTHGVLPPVEPSAVTGASARHLSTFKWSRIGPLPSGTGVNLPGGVWDGDELLVFGTDNTSDQRGVVWRFRPSDGSWRASPRAPASFVASGGFSSAVWAGHELVVVGEGTSTTDDVLAAIAYDPMTDRWRTLPPAPLCLANRASTAWTGRVLVVATGSIIHGTSRCTDPDGEGVALLDPSTNRWTRLPSLPLAAGHYVDAVSLTTAFDGVVALERTVAGVASSTPNTAAAVSSGANPVRDTRLQVLHAGATRWQSLGVPVTDTALLPFIYGTATSVAVVPMDTCRDGQPCVAPLVVGSNGQTRIGAFTTRVDLTAFTGGAFLATVVDASIDCIQASCERDRLMAWDAATLRLTQLGDAPSLLDAVIWTGHDVLAFGSETVGSASRVVLYRLGP
jgi:hypothetical protein